MEGLINFADQKCSILGSTENSNVLIDLFRYCIKFHFEVEILSVWLDISRAAQPAGLVWTGEIIVITVSVDHQLHRPGPVTQVSILKSHQHDKMLKCDERTHIRTDGRFG